MNVTIHHNKKEYDLLTDVIPRIGEVITLSISESEFIIKKVIDVDYSFNLDETGYKGLGFKSLYDLKESQIPQVSISLED